MLGNLQIETIEKIHGDIRALDSVTLDVELGGIFAVVGINGSGKTTLLRILAGLDEPDEGTIRLKGERMQAQQLRQVSTLVFQKTVVFRGSVLDNVGFGLKVRAYKAGEIQKRVSQALASVGLAGFEKRKARKLSGGEQQRVALARAFIVEPEILLLDEPTANLDPANAAIIEDTIRAIRKRETCTIMFATHNLHQAKRLSDRIIHIHYGKIMEISDSEEFFEHSSNETTRKFVRGELQY
ncbi:MAG: phosphate ABC transporter ATP-binding protein [archaeon]